MSDAPFVLRQFRTTDEAVRERISQLYREFWRNCHLVIVYSGTLRYVKREEVGPDVDLLPLSPKTGVERHVNALPSCILVETCDKTIDVFQSTIHHSRATLCEYSWDACTPTETSTTSSWWKASSPLIAWALRKSARVVRIWIEIIGVA